MVTGKFRFLDSTALATMLTEWQACLSAIAVANQSYSIAGRSFTRANLAEVSDMVAELSYASGMKGGTIKTRTYADMSNT
jgi:hypothetical protein